MARRSLKSSLFPVVDQLTFSDQAKRKRNSRFSQRRIWRLFALLLSLSAALIAFSSGRFVFAQNGNYTTVEELNNRLAGTITAESTLTLNITVDPNGAYDPDTQSPRYILTTTNPITGNGGGTNFSLAVNKLGSGVWRMGGESSYSAATNNQFIVQAGTLEMMRDASLEILSGANASPRFDLRDGTTLNARGVNTIKTTSILVGNNVTFGFDITADTSSGALLTLDGTINTANSMPSSGSLNLLGFKNQGSASGGQRITLLTYTYTGTAPAQGADPAYSAPPIRATDLSNTNADYEKNFELYVRGELWNDVVTAAGGRLLGTITQTTNGLVGTGGKVNIEIEDFYSQVGQVRWTNTAGTGEWNATDRNWQGVDITANTFLHGDNVLFDGTGQGNTITIQKGGIQLGMDRTVELTGEQIYGMHVTQGQYTFVNEADNIGIDGPGSLRVVNLLADPNNPTTVTFQSANSFWGGSYIGDNSQIVLEHSAGLGTGVVDVQELGKLVFKINKAEDIFYNDITGSGEIIKEEYDNTTLYIAGGVGGNINTTIKKGTLANNIGGGVLTVFKGATYDTVSGNRSIAGLRDGQDDVTGQYGGGTVEMRGDDLSISTVSGSEYSFSGLIKGDGTVLSKSGPGTQILVYNKELDDAGSYADAYTGGTNVYEGKLVGRAVLDNTDPTFPNTIEFNVMGSGDISISDGATLNYDIKHQDSDIVTTPYAARVDNRFYGKGDLVKTGDAMLILSGSSQDVMNGDIVTKEALTGNVLVQEGYLRLENNYATGKAKKVELSDGTVLQFSRTNPPGTEQQLMTGNSRSTPYDRYITGDGNVEVIENTKVFLKSNVVNDVTQASDYTGSTTIYSGGNLVLLDPTAAGQTSKIDLSDQTFDQTILPGTLPPGVLTLDFDSIKDSDGKETDQIFDRYITGAGDLVKDGAGTAVLSLNGSFPPNDYQGETFVNAGVLKLTYATATGKEDSPGDQSVTVAGGAFLELNFANDGETYNKGIKGEGALAKSGDNLVILGGYSTYTGGTYIYGGTLSFTDVTGQQGNLGTGGVYFQRGGGTLRNTKFVDDLGQVVMIDSSSTATFNTREDLTTSYDIIHNPLPDTDPYYDPNNPNSNLVKTGPANMTINGSAQWTGTTTVKEGWLYNNIPETTDLYVYTGAGYNTGAGKSVDGKMERIVRSIHGESDSAGGTIEVVEGTNLVVNYPDYVNPDIFAGSIRGKGGLVLVGNGRVNPQTGEVEYTELNLTGSNFYEGETIVRGRYGKLVGNIARGTNLTVDYTNYYYSGGADRTISSLNGYGNVNMEGRDLTIFQNDPAKDPIFYGNIENARNLSKQGVGSQTLAGMRYDFSGDVSVEQGRLRVGYGNSGSTMNVGGNLKVFPNTTNSPVVLDLGANTRINVTGQADLQGTLDMIASGSLIDAGSVKLGDDSVLNVTGIGEDDLTMIIRSKESIDTDFGTVNVAGAASSVDYLTLGVEKRNNNKEIWVGQTLRWYADHDAHGTFTLEDANGSYTVGRTLQDVFGTFDPAVWDGKTLTKKGPGTLILAMENTYTGKTIVEEGTLKLTNEKATGGSSEVALTSSTGRRGGTLELAFNSRNSDGTWSEGMKTPITGTGNVIKTGRGTVSVLSGNSSYTGRTEVQEGSLLIDGSITSDVYVSQSAGFGGNGTAGGNVTFESGSYYYWRFGATEAESDLLTVAGKMLIGDSVYFRPYTSLKNDEEITRPDGWTVIRYGDLFGKFAGVDSSANPFYTFELDYDTYGVIKISGSRLDQPRALSDVMSMSAVMAQTKMYRTAFQQIKREWSSDCPTALRQIRSNEDVRGQEASGMYRTAWMNFIGRGDHFESSYHNDDYSLQSYGVQTGVSLYSTCDRSFGLMFGREEAKLSNNSDKVENEDYYLGFYFARQFQRNFDFFGYVGGGWQKNDMVRRSNERFYGTNFNGNTFNFNFEIGKRFYNDRCTLFRPYFGFDVEIVRVGGGNEKLLDGADSNEKRNYRRSDLNQVFFKVGFETMRSWRKIDLLGGINLNWNIADTTPETRIYYPFVDKYVTGYGSDLGRFNVGLNVGMNWYLTERRNALFFIDYLGEIHQDRKNHFAYGTGTVGFSWRF